MLPQSLDPAGTAGEPALVNIYANDPNAIGMGIIQAAPLPGPSRFAIPGWAGVCGLFNPGTPQFQAGHLAVILGRTYEAWCDFFGGEIPWHGGIEQLPVVPRAGNDLNAYYDRQAVRFFFKNDAVTGGTVYTCESSDIVAHECGHALLDARRADYWDSLLAETGAFHEAFADISAVLVTLGEPSVRAAILAETGGDLTRSNAVSRLAEQLAQGICNGGHPESVLSPGALRDMTSKFRYRDPEKLPGRAPASKLSSESHSFSRVFSSAFYDLLVGIYAELRQVNGASADEAIVQACSVTGHLLAQGIVLAPPGDAPFKTIAACMVTADAQNFEGRYFQLMRKAFVQRRILYAREADALKKTGGAGHTETSTLEGAATVQVGKPVALQAAAGALGADLPSPVRRVLDLPRRAFVLAREQARPGGQVLQYVAPKDLQLRGADLGVARGAVVTMADSVALQVDADGRVVSSHRHKPDQGQARRIRDHVAKLVERGRVYAAAPGESIDPNLLIERKQPYYVAFDRAGNKRIRRAFIA